MSNFFTLELDTTPPKIEIYAPNYSIQNIETEIKIKSNEKLDYYQNIYIIDSNGDKHDLIFQYNKDELIGKIYLNNISVGIAKIYAQVRDEVLNLSQLIYKSINIYEYIELDLDCGIEIQKIETNNNTMKIELINSIQELDLNNSIQIMDINYDTCSIEVDMEEMK